MTVHSISFDQDVIDQRHLRHALGRFATGVTVITTRTAEGKLEGLTANSFSAVSLDPPLVLWSLRRNASSLSSFSDSGYFAVNVLAANQCDLSRHFATPSKDRFAGTDYAVGLGGCPLLPDCLASFECSTEHTVTGGDHIIFIGRVLRATYRDGEPLIFSAGKYCTHSLLADGV
ncbi:MAG TPA: flavin reductase family protein [Beijerinckiaceae bacterium]|jgi:flavin reductase (DIM6/NTAB) family NADH-FMN oxidoreductase RutF